MVSTTRLTLWVKQNSQYLVSGNSNVIHRLVIFLAWTRIFFENFLTNIDPTNTKTLVPKRGPFGDVMTVDLKNGLDDKVDHFGSKC